MVRILIALILLPFLLLPASAQSPGTPFHLVAANSNNATVIKPDAGLVLGVQLGGIGSAPAYLKLYDKATAPTCGTDTPKKTLIIPAAATAANGAGSNVSLSFSTRFTLGIGICVVAGIAVNDNTSVAAATYVINIDYE